MQKVEGSSPFSRFEKPRKCGVFLWASTCRATTASALPHAHQRLVARLGGLSQLDRLE